MNYDSPKEIASFLEEHGLALKKKWGQNFLVSGAARNAIVDRLAPGKSDLVWEIGPGLGAMTRPVIESGARLIAFEIDRGMIRSLGLLFRGEPNITIIEGDFVKTFEGAISRYGEPSKIFGNLPYSSASKIILMLIMKRLKAGILVFTVQKELADRMASLPRKKSYSSFSVLSQYAFEIETPLDLAPHNFFPQPDVASTVVVLKPREGSPVPVNEDFFFSVCRAAFSSRRKTLANNLSASGLLGAGSKLTLGTALEQLGFKPGARAEELGASDFVALSDLLLRTIKPG